MHQTTHIFPVTEQISLHPVSHLQEAELFRDTVQGRYKIVLDDIGLEIGIGIDSLK
jgi:hypothetical protein